MSASINGDLGTGGLLRSRGVHLTSGSLISVNGACLPGVSCLVSPIDGSVLAVLWATSLASGVTVLPGNPGTPLVLPPGVDSNVNVFWNPIIKMSKHKGKKGICLTS